MNLEQQMRMVLDALPPTELQPACLAERMCMAESTLRHKAKKEGAHRPSTLCILERSRRIAEALEFDPKTHVDELAKEAGMKYGQDVTRHLKRWHSMSLTQARQDPVRLKSLAEFY